MKTIYIILCVSFLSISLSSLCTHLIQSSDTQMGCCQWKYSGYKKTTTREDCARAGGYFAWGRSCY